MYVVLSVLCITFVVALGERQRILEASQLLSVTAVEPERVFVEWTVVRQWSSDPVLGYKILIYEIPEYTDSNTMVRKDVSLQEFNVNNTYPVTREEILKGRDTKATVDGIKNNVLYEVRVAAYKAHVDGPPSKPIRIKTLKENDYNAVISRTNQGCQISVPLGSERILDETYPYLYNSYF